MENGKQFPSIKARQTIRQLNWVWEEEEGNLMAKVEEVEKGRTIVFTLRQISPRCCSIDGRGTTKQVRGDRESVDLNLFQPCPGTCCSFGCQPGAAAAAEIR